MVRILCALMVMGAVDAHAAFGRVGKRQSSFCMSLLSATHPRGELEPGVLIDHREDTVAWIEKFFSRMRVAREELRRQALSGKNKKERSAPRTAQYVLALPAATLAILADVALLSAAPLDPVYSVAGLAASFVLGGIDYPVRYFTSANTDHEQLLETYEEFKTDVIEGATWGTRLHVPLWFIEKIRDLSRPDWPTAHTQNVAEELAGAWRFAFPKMNADPQTIEVNVRMYKEDGAKKMHVRMDYSPKR